MINTFFKYFSKKYRLDDYKDCSIEYNSTDLEVTREYLEPSEEHDSLLVQMCILSAIMYDYATVIPSNENSTINVTEKKIGKDTSTDNENYKLDVSSNNFTVIKSSNPDFKKLLGKLNIRSDACRIYNLDNILVFGIFIIGKTMIVSFKGSSNLQDFCTDINFIQTEFKTLPDIKGKVHQGSYNTLFDKNRYLFIIKKIKEYSIIVDNINITGHSLGGLTGTIFYAILKQVQLKELGVEKKLDLYTYGCPRVGNSAFTKNIICKRIVNKFDIVTCLPFPFFYNHPTQKIQLGRSSIFDIFNIFRYNITDHQMNDYYKSLIIKCS